MFITHDNVLRSCSIDVDQTVELLTTLQNNVYDMNNIKQVRAIGISY